MDEVKLERFKLIVLQYITEELAEKLAEPPVVRLICDELVIRLVQALWGREAARQEVRYPANWWEAVKKRFAPEWVKQRWPIQEEVVTIIARELYPKIALPGRECVIAVDKTTTVIPAGDDEDWDDDC